VTADQIIATDSVELADIFTRYRVRKEAEGVKAQTLVNFTRAVVPFQAWLDARGTAAEDVTEDDLLEYFAGSHHAPSTKRVHWSQIKAAYRRAHRKSEIEVDPFTDLKPPKVPEREPTAIQSAELRAMRARCRDWKQTLLWALLAYTGLRRDEIRRLAWDTDAENRVNLADLEISVLGKGGKRRVVPIHPMLAELLETAPDSKGFHGEHRTGAIIFTTMTGGGVGGSYATGQSLERLKDQFADEGCHAFRRTLASSLSRNGVDSITIDRIFGWAPSDMKGRYYVSKTPADLRRGILEAYVDDPIGN
jgi:integrase